MLRDDKSYEITIYYDEVDLSLNQPQQASLDFTFKIDHHLEKQYQNLPIPDSARTSLSDAIYLSEVKSWLSINLILGNLSFLEELNFSILLLLHPKSYAYRAWELFPIEVAKFINQHPGTNSLFTPEVFIQLQDISVVPKSVLSRVNERNRQKLNTKYENNKKSKLDTYEPSLLMITPSYSNPIYQYFKNLFKYNHDITISPEDHLTSNMDGAEKSDEKLLLHVRECEDLGCILHLLNSPCVRQIHENLQNQINKFIKTKQKTDTIFLGEFASGNLLRTLRIVESLIKSGYKKFEFCFIDRIYETLIEQCSDHRVEPDLAKTIEMNIALKSLREFASWICSNTDTNVKIHLFSDVHQAEQFFHLHPDKKLTLLIGQDYFTPDGCRDEHHATPDSHEHFMRLAAASLNRQGRFFELIKNQAITPKIYLHVGRMINGEYHPYYTNDHQVDIKKTKVFLNTSLQFFSPDCKDNPKQCEQGKEYLVYNIQGDVINEESTAEALAMLKFQG